MQRAGPAEVHQHRATVIADDAEPVQMVEQVGVVRVPEVGLRVGSQHSVVQVRGDGDQVLATDGGEHGGDRGVGEGVGQVPRAVTQVGTHDPGGWVLHRLQAVLLAQPTQAQLVHVGEQARQAGGG
ncbi:hypothetical protein Vlu01_02340 [Micromonospora lutea]|uniref:Uncharacterized protein n=1 Tax=Micromonospora lutea TaxID=419825 RepID=A0ABQ4IP43_9ACTN|nr:hypothetical protein Vlu01_02340 [Micromonospora lutea]